MATIDPKPLTRDQLASFLDSNELIRRFERLFQVSGTLTPAQIELLFQQVAILFRLAEEASIDAGTADAKANSAADALAALNRLCDLLATAPAQSQDSLTAAVRALEIESSRPPAEMPRSFPVDYIDFDATPKHVDAERRVAWNFSEDTLNIHHSGGVVQQVGQELFGYFINNIGSPVANGEVIGFDAAANTFTKYIADGTYASELVIGIATQDIANGEMGRATIWGRVRGLDTTGTPFGETWAAGDLLYASPTVAGGLTNIKPTAPDLSIPMGIVRVVDAVNGQIASRPVIEQQLYYGTFIKTSDQTPAAINTAYAITWDSSSIADGVSIGAPASRLVVAHAGLYKFSVSFQLTSGSASVKNVWLWFRKNGVDVADSAMITSLDSATAIRTPSRSLFFSLQAGDYIEVMFASDSTAMTIDNIPATAFAPAAPAAIITVNQEQQ